MNTSKRNKAIVNFLITVIFFVFEALIHFSVGRQSAGKTGRDRLPTPSEFGEILGYVALFALLSTGTIFLVNTYFFKDAADIRESRMAMRELRQLEKRK